MPEDHTPPIGDHQHAEKYLNQLIAALKSHRFELVHSDLSRFDPSTFQDHYRLDMGEYHAEISHSKHPHSGSDIYSLVFTSVDKMRRGETNQAILSYLPLTAEQFSRFKSSSSDYFAEQKRREERKRFESAMQPVDNLLNQDNREYHPPTSQEPDTTTPNDSQFFHEFSSPKNTSPDNSLLSDLIKQR